MSFEHPLFGKMLEPKDMSDEHHEAIRRCLDEVGEPASPVPLETMIEEMGGVNVLQVGVGQWVASPNPTIGFDMEDTHRTPREALESLHAAWRER